ncbi:MAG: Histidinol-phosphate aminotransferase [Turneriella sp.]|nr:Histidinol-phosphate aminotransferase [Turneriella sp.]
MERSFLNTITQNASPYTPGEQVNEPGWIKLNTNESPLPPSPQVAEKMRELSLENNLLRKYSHPMGEPLLSALADYLKIDKSCILVTNGSDEALALLCRASLDSTRAAAFPKVTYSLYKTLVKNVGGIFHEVAPVARENQPYGVDIDALEKSTANVVFLANPNAITGELIDTSILRKTIENSSKLWVIDEAYNDFAGKDATMLPFVPKLDNLVVTRTFSKTHALAGLRVGYLATSNISLMQGLIAHKDSYNEDALAARLAKSALEDVEWSHKILSTVAEGHIFLNTALKKLGFIVYASRANFLLAKAPPKMDAETITKRLREYKLLIRYYPKSIFADCVRISIGAPEENKKLVDALEKILQQ